MDPMDTLDPYLVITKKNGSDGYIGSIFSYKKKIDPLDSLDPYLVIKKKRIRWIHWIHT
jgi:hypothetical protein